MPRKHLSEEEARRLLALIRERLRYLDETVLMDLLVERQELARMVAHCKLLLGQSIYNNGVETEKLVRMTMLAVGKIVNHHLSNRILDLMMRDSKHQQWAVLEELVGEGAVTPFITQLKRGWRERIAVLLLHIAQRLLT